MLHATALLQQYKSLREQHPSLFQDYGGTRVPRVSSWSEPRISLLRLTLELPVYWHVSGHEQSGFLRALTDTQVFAEQIFESPLRRSSVEDLFAATQAAKVTHKLLSRDIGDEVARKFYITFLDMLEQQYGMFSNDLGGRDAKLNKLLGAVLRFGLRTYFADSGSCGLPAKDMRVFVYALLKYLDHGNSMSWKIGYRFGSWMEERTRILLKHHPELGRSTWGQMSQAIATISEHPGGHSLTNGAMDKIGRAIHYMWGMQVSLGNDRPKSSLLHGSKQAGMEKEVKQALFCFRKALRIQPFNTKFGDTAETRAIFVR